MSDAKWTPGPWEWRKGTSHITHRWNGRDVVIADVVRPGWHEDRFKAAEEAGANAELIAAAPETKAKLDELIESVDRFLFIYNDDGELTDALNEARSQ